MKKLFVFIFSISLTLYLFAADSRGYIYGDVKIAQNNELPSGCFAKSKDYLPGDTITIVNSQTGENVNVLNLGTLGKGEENVILLAPEAARKLDIDLSQPLRMQISSRTSNFDEIASGSAVIAYGRSADLPVISESFPDIAPVDNSFPAQPVAKSVAPTEKEEIPEVSEPPVSESVPVVAKKTAPVGEPVAVVAVPDVVVSETPEKKYGYDEPEADLSALDSVSAPVVEPEVSENLVENRAKPATTEPVKNSKTVVPSPVAEETPLAAKQEQPLPVDAFEEIPRIYAKEESVSPYTAKEERVPTPKTAKTAEKVSEVPVKNTPATGSAKNIPVAVEETTLAAKETKPEKSKDKKNTVVEEQVAAAQNSSSAQKKDPRIEEETVDFVPAKPKSIAPVEEKPVAEQVVPVAAVKESKPVGTKSETVAEKAVERPVSQSKPFVSSENVPSTNSPKKTPSNNTVPEKKATVTPTDRQPVQSIPAPVQIVDDNPEVSLSDPNYDVDQIVSQRPVLTPTGARNPSGYSTFENAPKEKSSQKEPVKDSPKQQTSASPDTQKTAESNPAETKPPISGSEKSVAIKPIADEPKPAETKSFVSDSAKSIAAEPPAESKAPAADMYEDVYTKETTITLVPYGSQETYAPISDSEKSVAIKPVADEPKPAETKSFVSDSAKSIAAEPPAESKAPVADMYEDVYTKETTITLVPYGSQETYAPKKNEEKKVEKNEDDSFETVSQSVIALNPTEAKSPKSDGKNVSDAGSKASEKSASDSKTGKPSKRGRSLVIKNERDLKKGAYYIQFTTTSDKAGAEAETNGKARKYPVVAVPFEKRDGYKMLAGPFTVDEYGAIFERLKMYGYKDAFVRHIK